MLTIKQYLNLTGTIFSIIGFLHLIRLFTGWPIVLVGFSVPVWISGIGIVIAWVLAYSAFMLAKKKKS